jgi:hypothetical protein
MDRKQTQKMTRQQPGYFVRHPGTTRSKCSFAWQLFVALNTKIHLSHNSQLTVK